MMNNYHNASVTFLYLYFTPLTRYYIKLYDNLTIKAGCIKNHFPISIVAILQDFNVYHHLGLSFSSTEQHGEQAFNSDILVTFKPATGAWQVCVEDHVLVYAPLLPWRHNQHSWQLSKINFFNDCKTVVLSTDLLYPQLNFYNILNYSCVALNSTMNMCCWYTCQPSGRVWGWVALPCHAIHICSVLRELSVYTQRSLVNVVVSSTTPHFPHTWF